MDSIHFLNIEYIILRLQVLLSDTLAKFTGETVPTGTSAGDGAEVVSHTTPHIISTLSFITEQLALLGMAIAFILLVAALYIRIKLELYEHEEFHKREAKYHTHGAHDSHGGHDTHTPHAAHTDGHASQHDAPAATPVAEAPGHARWQDILHLASTPHESDWRRAIMEADIMLGNLLEQQGYRGQSIGDKLKDANPLQFTTLDAAWKAHRVRNDIAHQGDSFHLSERDTQATIDHYRRVFEEFQFI